MIIRVEKGTKFGVIEHICSDCKDFFNCDIKYIYKNQVFVAESCSKIETCETCRRLQIDSNCLECLKNIREAERKEKSKALRQHASACKKW